MYTIEQIVGNLLISSETRESFVFTMEHISEFASKLDCGPVTWNMVKDVCAGMCVIDFVNHTVCLDERNRVQVCELNRSLSVRDALYLESMARWFVAVTFKNESDDFMAYTRLMAHFASSAMDCVR